MNIVNKWNKNVNDQKNNNYKMHLDILSKAVEHLFGHCHSFREVSLAWFIYDVFSWVIPVEITDRLLERENIYPQSNKCAESNTLSGFSRVKWPHL